jgi:catechol 2,3-dioxygenase-like lactoylglutathione lyase family enzyme
VTVPTYFHIGVIVPDLDRAAADFSRVLGLTFTDPAVVHVPWFVDPTPHEHTVHAVFSEDGPPYYELIQAAGDGIFSAREAGQILYLGMWESDMAGRMRTLQENGIGIDAQLKASEDAVPFCIITKPDVLGIRLEYVDESAHPGIERWVHTGKFEGL